ncbi:MAG: LCP family protein [Firmicutes bacterium]|nr:LCP family protein [Bacillota bacterium]
MARSQDFWSQDRTTIHQKSSWFAKLTVLQKISYVLLLLFVISWCFYLGMNYAFATAPVIEREIKDGSEWKKELQEETEEVVIRLSGVDVALLVGSDKRPEETRYRTDTIILAFYNWDADQLKLLSIPRDSYVQCPGRDIKTKINEAYFYGGMPLLESAIEYTFGIEVDHCVEIDFAGFLQMIDALGGVEIDVPQRMYKPTEEINIQKGLQTLNGYDALAFVRYRTLPMGDIDRIANQQKFISALAKKIAGSSLWQASQLVKIGMDHTSSNYSFSEALLLGAALFKTDLLDIPMYSLPGTGLYMVNKAGEWINYWILNKKGTIEMITEITGGEVGDFHIISDEGKGVEKAPAKVDSEEGDEEDAAENDHEDSKDDEDNENTDVENPEPADGQDTKIDEEGENSLTIDTEVSDSQQGQLEELPPQQENTATLPEPTLDAGRE